MRGVRASSEGTPTTIGRGDGRPTNKGEGIGVLYGDGEVSCEILK